MKRLFRNLLIFACAVVLIDVCFGFVCNYLHDNATSGGTAKRVYVAKKSTDDIIMFGSSRMLHHYVPQMFEDSLGMTCFNAGEDGCGIIVAYGYLQMLMKRHTPRLIVYDVFPDYDLREDDKSKYLTLLKPFYQDPDVRQIIYSVSSNERFKMLSSLYRYNSRMPALLAANIGGSTEYHNGYEPLSGVMDYETDIPTIKPMKEDTLKLRLFKDFITLCRHHNVPILFCVSPTYKGFKTNEYDNMRQLCEGEYTYFWNFFDCDSIVNDRSLFQDQYHLNAVGASKFTSIVVNRLKDVAF
ncbi:MAG: hypothetical protein Q4F34_03300 [Prevotellaceae bacterium]|nr:hypothetical protein [Prevotellaceae bacterium]